jgi:protein SCO1/2
VAALLLSVAATADDALPYYNSSDFSPHWFESTSPELEGFHQIPPFSFTNQQGETITEASFGNKIYVANFFFSSCPGICPAIRSKLINVQQKFIDDADVEILSHSIRPSTDTVEVLQQYAQLHGIQDHKWHLVTGEKSVIYSLANEAYFANEDLGNIANSSDFLHTENLLLIDQSRHIRGVYNGLNSTSVNYLMADIARLKAQSSR